MRLYILVSFWTLVAAMPFRVLCICMGKEVGTNLFGMLLGIACAAWAGFLLWAA